MDVTNEEEFKRVLRREQRRKKPTVPKTKSSTHSGFVRVIGGDLRARKLHFKVEESTRPMKDRTREAIFNLIGQEVKGKIAIDLFAGSGILAVEAISRGALTAAIVEKQSFRASEIIANLEKIDLLDCCRVFTADAFRVSHNPTKLVESITPEDIESSGWLIFCCPPYSLWTDNEAEMSKLVKRWLEQCPVDSLMVIELPDAIADSIEFDTPSIEWLRRSYKPAIVAIGTKIFSG
jgi:16S rRNA (guanine966-N2)-methyltransferase